MIKLNVKCEWIDFRFDFLFDLIFYGCLLRCRLTSFSLLFSFEDPKTISVQVYDVDLCNLDLILVLILDLICIWDMIYGFDFRFNFWFEWIRCGFYFSRCER